MDSLQKDKSIIIPVLVSNDKTCDIYVPDMNITIHGQDFVDAYANVIINASAIYYYNRDRNVDVQFKTTYSDVEALCCKRGQFATVINIAT